MAKNRKKQLPRDEADFLAEIAEIYNEQMTQYLDRMNRVIEDAVQAAQESLDAGQRYEHAAGIFAFARDRGILEAVSLLPPRHLTRAEFDALPVAVPDDATANGWHRKQLAGAWIVVNLKENGMVGIFKPEIDGSSPLN
jgi:hypothetical protein